MKYYRIATGQGAAWAREQGDQLQLLVGDPWTGTSDSHGFGAQLSVSVTLRCGD